MHTQRYSMHYGNASIRVATIKRAFTCLALGLTISASAAQTAIANNTPGAPKREQIITMLRSHTTRDQAWGAYYAARAHDKTLIPELLRVADSWQPLDLDDTLATAPTDTSPAILNRRDATAGALDALIQLRAVVPEETVRGVASDFGNEASVLLARIPHDQAGTLAFDLYKSSSHHAGSIEAVSASLLALHPVPGFAASLMSNIHVRMYLTIVDPDAGGGSGWGSSSGDCMGGGFVSHQGWPPTPRYQVIRERVTNSFAIVRGAVPIYARRVEAPRYSDGQCGGSIGLSDEDRRVLVAEMLGVDAAKAPWQIDVHEQVIFRTLPQVSAEILKFVEDEQSKYRQTISQLMQSSLIEAVEDESAMPSLEIQLTDLRQHPSDDLEDEISLPQHAAWLTRDYPPSLRAQKSK